MSKEIKNQENQQKANFSKDFYKNLLNVKFEHLDLEDIKLDNKIRKMLWFGIGIGAASLAVLLVREYNQSKTSNLLLEMLIDNAEISRSPEQFKNYVKKYNISKQDFAVLVRNNKELSDSIDLIYNE